MGKHSRRHTIETGRHRAPKEKPLLKTRLGITAAISASALGAGIAAPELILQTTTTKSSPDASPTPDVTPTSSPSAKSPTPEHTTSECPAPDPTLVERYKGQVPAPSVSRLDTDSSVAIVNQAQTPQEMLRAANTALKGEIVVRLATQKDNEIPRDNTDMTDRPAVTTATNVSATALRSTVAGVLQAYDGMPEGIGTIEGYPSAVVLTEQIITPDPADSISVIGGYNGEEGRDSYLMLRIGETTDDTMRTVIHEDGHRIHEAGTGHMPETDCFKDPHLTHPDQLTQYSMDNSGLRETAADTYAIGVGATFPDQYPNATTDGTNADNFAVLMGRLAEQGPQQKLVADALYNQSVYAPY